MSQSHATPSPPSTPDYAEAQAYLYSLKTSAATYGIDRIRAFTDALGQPQTKTPTIHVAGTNGKGSVCAMLEQIYRDSGLRTGLYTSPHLIHLGERIRTNGQRLHPADITRMLPPLREIAERTGRTNPDMKPSFFEFMTAMAFQRFAEARCDIALIETGLGGRLDATNVLTPHLSIITSIGLDHTEILGDTLEKIAAEKAGIIKPGVPVIIGKLPPAAEHTIREIAAERKAPLHSIADHFGDAKEPLPSTNLHGGFQQLNAATALLATRILHGQFPIDEHQAHNSLNDVTWQGRWQTHTLSDDRTLILDATHNPEGAQHLAQNLAQLTADTGRKPILIAGSLGNDRAQALMQAIAPHAQEIYLLKPNQPRACDFEALEAALARCQNPPPAKRAQLANLFPEPNTCTLGDAEDTIVATGSIYLIGEIMQRLEPQIQGEPHLQD